jgi:NADPH2:quinone reductase
MAPLEASEARVRVEAAGLNHAETLIRSGAYTVRLPFPYALGGEGSGAVVEAGPEAGIPLGARVCWAGVMGSCATFITAPASKLVPLPDPLSFEDGACLPVAGLTASGLARVWPLEGRVAVVWGAAGAVGRMLVAILAGHGADVIGIASGKRTDAVRAAGARNVIDRTSGGVPEAVRAATGGHGADAVFDPIGAPTFETSLQLLAPRGCLINYGELRGPVPALDLRLLFPGSVFLTKYNGMHWVAGLEEFPTLIAEALRRAVKTPAVISSVAGRFPLDRVADAYRALESDPGGKILVLPNVSFTG